MIGMIFYVMKWNIGIEETIAHRRIRYRNAHYSLLDPQAHSIRSLWPLCTAQSTGMQCNATKNVRTAERELGNYDTRYM